MPTSRTGYRADLEALRGLAILLVVAYHAGVPALAGGFVGVDVFFVLSGYFAARLLVQEYGATGSVNLLRFWGRRAMRLLPALLVVVVATLAAVWLIWAPIDRAGVADTARAVLSGRANDAFARNAVNYFGNANSPFLHMWSLGVELQVALFGPAFVFALAVLGGWRPPVPGDEHEHRLSSLVRGVPLGLVIIGALSLGIAIWSTSVNPSWAFFATPARAWEFVAGAVLALTLPAGSTAVSEADVPRGRGWWIQAVGLAVIVFAALHYDRSTPYPGTAAMLPVLGALAVIAGGVRGRGVLTADDGPVRALGWFGQLSYSWYLWHWPMVVAGAVLVPTIGVWGRLAWSAAALVPALFTYHWVERPMRERGGESATRTSWLPAVALAACLILALGAGLMRQSAQRRVAQPDQRALAAARVDRMSHDCWDREASRAVTTCVFGDPNGAATVALFGDSHAEHWLAAFDRLGRERGWRVVLLVKGGCAVADAPELIDSRSTRWGRECASYRAAAVRALIALDPDVAVLSSYDEYVTRGVGPSSDVAGEGRISPVAWERGLRSTYARLAGAGVPVVAIRGTPYPGFDVPACLSRRAARLPMANGCQYMRDEALHRSARAAQHSAVRDVSARGLPVAAIDMAGEVCSTRECGVMRSGRVVFTDGNHLTASFTRLAAGAVSARLDAALAGIGVRLP